MKKLFLIAIAAGLMLCGCGAADGAEKIEKAQEIRVYSGDTDECVQTLGESADIDELIRLLNPEDWTKAALPEQAEISGIFVLRQDETLKLGQRPEDREMEELCRMYFYKNESIVRLECPDLLPEYSGPDLTFEVPEETADALNTYL